MVLYFPWHTRGPHTTSGDENGAIHLIATTTLVFHQRIPCKHVLLHMLLRRAQPCQTSWQFHYQILHCSTSMPTAIRVPAGKNACKIRTNVHWDEHNNCERKTSPVASLCWSRSKWNIRHFIKHRRRQRLWHSSCKITGIFLSTGKYNLRRVQYLTSKTERGWIAGQLSHQTSPSRQVAKSQIQWHWQRDQRAHYFDMQFKLSTMLSLRENPTLARSPVKSRKTIIT